MYLFKCHDVYGNVDSSYVIVYKTKQDALGQLRACLEDALTFERPCLVNDDVLADYLDDGYTEEDYENALERYKLDILKQGYYNNEDDDDPLEFSIEKITIGEVIML